MSLLKLCLFAYGFVFREREKERGAGRQASRQADGRTDGQTEKEKIIQSKVANKGPKNALQTSQERLLTLFVASTRLLGASSFFFLQIK